MTEVRVLLHNTSAQHILIAPCNVMGAVSRLDAGHHLRSDPRRRFPNLSSALRQNRKLRNRFGDTAVPPD